MSERLVTFASSRSYVCTALLTALLFVACANDSTMPPAPNGSGAATASAGGSVATSSGGAIGTGGGTGGAVAAGGAGGSTAGTGGSTGGTGGSLGVSGGAAGTTSGGSGGSGGSGVTFACSHTAVPESGTITDFDPWSGTGEWGEDMGLTGGSYTYGNSADGSSLTATVTSGVMHVTGSVSSYAGFGLWFGPCSDASAFTGITMTVGGTLPSGSELEFQAQTSRNYPVSSTDMKGECMGTWGSPCASNVLNDVTPAVAIQVPWTMLTGGAPIAPLDPTELIGIQWQFNCDAGSAPCAIDVTLDDIAFY